MADSKRMYNVEMQAPDGGWGYCVCIGFTFMFFACTSHSNSFGMIFNDFMIDNKESASSFTIVQGVCGIMISVAGLTINVALKHFSIRQMSLLGSLFFSLAWFFNYFIANVSQMIFTNGILSGIGMGLIMSTSYTIFNAYFVKKRIMMMSICMSIVGLASIVAPFIVKSYMEMFGFRGTLLLITGVSMQSFVGSMLYQPVEWHLVPKIIVVRRRGSKGIVLSKNPMEKKAAKQLINLTRALPRKSIVDIEAIKAHKEERRSIWKIIANQLDLSLLKRFDYFNVCLATAIGIFTDIQFYVLQPLLLFEYGFTTSQVALCVSITSITDLASRIFLAIFGHFWHVDSRFIFYIGLVLTSICRFLFAQYHEYTWVAYLTGILGFLRGFVYVPMSLMPADILPRERCAAGFGLTILANGLGNAAFSPFAGIIKDKTGSYVGAFFMFSALGLIAIIPWTIEFVMLYKNNKLNFVKK